MSIFRRRRGRTSTRAARTNARRAANLKRTRDAIRKTKVKNPNIALAQLARRRGQKPTSSGVPARMAEAAGNFFSRLGTQRAEANKKKTVRTQKRTTPPTRRVSDPGPNSPERQRKRNRKPAIDPPKAARKRRTRPTTRTPVRRARRKPSERFNRGF